VHYKMANSKPRTRSTLTFVMESRRQVIFPDSCLLVFIDETGGPLFTDPTYPIFGLGGCVVPVTDYVDYLRDSWTQMKTTYFGGASIILHASGGRKPGKRRAEAVANFLGTSAFGRIAAVVTNKTMLVQGIRPYQLAAGALVDCLVKVAKCAFTEIVLIFEESASYDTVAFREFEGYGIVRDGCRIPLAKYRMPKGANEPGLEIADCLIHAIGSHVRKRLATSTEPAPDPIYASAFINIPSSWQSSIEITKVF